MKSIFEIKDMIRIKRMKKIALSSIYCCSGEIYKLLDDEIVKKLILNIDNGKIKLKSDLYYGKINISLEENFISILDSYIGYVRDTYSIKHNGLIMILSETLKNRYNKCLFSKKEYHFDTNMFRQAFKRMFCANLISNTCYYAKIDVNKQYNNIHKANDFLKEKKINDEKDLHTIENFYINLINNCNVNLYNLFIPYNEVNKQEVLFYLNQLDYFYENLNVYD